MDKPNTQETIKKDFSLIDIVKIFLRNKKIIISLSLLVAVVTGLIVFLVVDPIFLSSGTIKATSKSSGLGSLLGGGMPDLGEIGNITGELGVGTKELALYENILTSRRCIEETITRFNLNEEWEFAYNFDAVKHFRQNVMEITKDKMAATMQIGIYDKNPDRAKEIVEFLIFELNKINTELNVQNAKNNREFIESRYELVKTDLKKAEDSLKMYQDVYGIAPDIKLKGIAESEVTLELQIKSEEVKLELLKKMISPGEADVKIQEQKIASLTQQLNEIQNNTGNQSSMFTLKGAPEIVMNYLRLTRDVEIQNKILTFVIPMFEQAKVDEKRETPSLLVLDPPNVPDKKAKPKRLITILIATFITFVLILLFFIFREKWKQYKTLVLN